MSVLSSYPDVFNTCLIILRKQGFELAYEKSKEHWLAIRGEFSFRADNPIELLGLAAIYKELQPQESSEYWWKLDAEDVLSELDPE